MLEQDKGFFAADGLMKLAAYTDIGAYGENLPGTCGNDNGILFAVEYYWLLLKTNQLTFEDEIRFQHSLDMLETTRSTVWVSGLYDRNPGRTETPNSFDNYVGTVAGDVLFSSGTRRPISRAVADHGNEFDGIYDNVNAGKPKNEWDITHIHQPSEWAFYNIAAGYTPGFVSVLWLAGAWITAIRKYKGNDIGISGILLAWLQINSMRKIQRLYTFKDLGGFCQWYVTGLNVVGSWFERKLLAVTEGKGIERVFELYFQDRGHPCRRLSKGITF